MEKLTHKTNVMSQTCTSHATTMFYSHICHKYRLVDQLEFADVILVNKTDIADKHTVGKVLRLIETLNPRAKVISTVKCRVPLEEILNTHRFLFEDAVTGAGWLQSLRESELRITANGSTRNIPKPETEEYGYV